MPTSTAVDQSAVARVVGIKTNFVDLRGGVVLLPQRIAVIGQGATAATYSTDKRQVFSAADAGQAYGFGSPVHLAVKELLPNNGDGVGTIPVTVYPLEDAGSGVAATGDITPAGAATSPGAYRVIVNEILSEQFVISPGDSIATIVTAMTNAINAVLDMPVVATDSATQVDLEAKWAGTSSNGITVAVDGPTGLGVTFAITQLSGGLVNPDVDDALAQIGNVWESLALNCLEISDTTSLDKYSLFGEGRWGALVRKPLVVFTGTTEADVATAIAIPDARPTDRVNSQLVAPGSDELPFVVAARMLARIAVIANNNPPRDYGSLSATGLVPGPDSDQWTYLQKDTAVKAGSSTSDVVDGVVTLSDTVTFYHPTGEVTPAYRYVCDIVKLQNILFNLDLIFATPEWDGAPLLPDSDPTSNRSAKKPKMAVAEVASMVDSLGLEAILSDPAGTKPTIQAWIDDQNPKRLNVCFTVKLSGNTNIISIDLNFGFYFGVTPLVSE